jgi:beta-fructofuranosidase
VAAGGDGRLVIRPVKYEIEDVFSALPTFNRPKIDLEGVGRTATTLFEKVKCDRPYMISFDIQSTSAASFSLTFDVGVDLKDCYLRFVLTG